MAGSSVVSDAQCLCRLRRHAICLPPTNSAASPMLQQGMLPQWMAIVRLMSSLPPYTELTMPALSPTMSQGNIASWQVKEGDEVQPGDMLCDVETDKATMGWENQDDGFVAKIMKPAGSQDVPVGTPVLILVEDKDQVPAFADYQPDSGQEAKAQQEQPSAPSSGPGASAQPQPEAPAHAEFTGRIWPAARLLLEQAGLSPNDVQPSSHGGIITKADVIAAIDGGVKPSSKEQKAQPAQLQQQKQQPEAKAAKAEPKSKSAPERQAAEKEQPSPSSPDRPRIPDSNIRAILASQMLAKGEKVPDKWLLDWVGFQGKQASASQ